MKFKLEIEIDNEAFRPDARHEIVRLLRQAAQRIESRAVWPLTLLDINGNAVGKARLR